VEFTLNGRLVTLDAKRVRERLATATPDPIQTHWVEVEGERWPPKQAFRLALGGTDEAFISHFALRVFRRLDFATSALPSERATAVPVQATSVSSDSEDAARAFQRLDAFMSATSLRNSLAGLESSLLGADRGAAAGLVTASGFDLDLIESAMVIRERVGKLDSLIHAAVISLALPLILEPGEVVTNRPSLGAGNDSSRPFDLETNFRVAEFKVASWQGQDSMRQRGLFADAVGLSLDRSGRRRELYVLGELPIRFLTRSRANATTKLSKSALRLREDGVVDSTITVSEYVAAAGIVVIDLRTVLPDLR
jgi:hypothetical protein